MALPFLHIIITTISPVDVVFVNKILQDIFFFRTHQDNVKMWNQVYELPPDSDGHRIINTLKKSLKYLNIHIPIKLSETGTSIICVIPPWVRSCLIPGYIQSPIATTKSKQSSRLRRSWSTGDLS